MNITILNQVFGEIARSSNEIYEMIIDEISKNKNEYVYMSMEAFQLNGITKGAGWVNEYMAHEILQRIYFATLTGYLRQCKWMEGICQGIETNNFMLFSSSARGFLESATDYYDALEDIPLTLAENYKLFCEALSGHVNEKIIGFGAIEDKLLHFQEANKAEGKNNSNLKPKTAKEYMESKNLKRLDLYSCYGELCEITHPAKQSLDCFIDEKNYIYTINLNKDEEEIKTFLKKYSHKYSELLMRTENVCIITFQMINLFKIERLYLYSADKINTKSVKIWDKINSYINQ